MLRTSNKYGRREQKFKLEIKKNSWNKKLLLRKKKHIDLVSKKNKKVCKSLGFNLH